MKKLLLVMALLITTRGNAVEFDYSRVLTSDTGRIGKMLVRYLYPTPAGCILIQSLVPGDDGKISSQTELCSVNGKSFDDLTYVGFERGEFKGEKLCLHLSIIPRQPVVEHAVACEVIFSEGLAESLSCIKKENAANTCEVNAK